MKINKKIKFLIFFILLSAGFSWGGVKLNNKIEWKITEDLIAQNVGDYDVGCKFAQITPCVIITPPPPGIPFCFGPAWCNGLDAARCLAYSDVIAQPAGPQECSQLFLNSSITQAGLVTNADYIASGLGPNLMDQGPLASWGGCVNCFAEGENEWLKKFAVAKDMFMALFKD